MLGTLAGIEERDHDVSWPTLISDGPSAVRTSTRSAGAEKFVECDASDREIKLAVDARGQLAERLTQIGQHRERWHVVHGQYQVEVAAGRDRRNPCRQAESDAAAGAPPQTR